MIKFTVFVIILVLILLSIIDNIKITKIKAIARGVVEGYGLQSTSNTNYGFIHPFYLQQTVNDDIDDLVAQQNYYHAFGYIESPYYIEFGEGSPYLKHSKPAPYYPLNDLGILHNKSKLPKYKFDKSSELMSKGIYKPDFFYPHAYIKRKTN